MLHRLQWTLQERQEIQIRNIIYAASVSESAENKEVVAEAVTYTATEPNW